MGCQCRQTLAHLARRLLGLDPVRGLLVTRIDVLDQAIGLFSSELAEDLAHLDSQAAAARPRVMGE